MTEAIAAARGRAPIYPQQPQPPRAVAPVPDPAPQDAAVVLDGLTKVAAQMRAQTREYFSAAVRPADEFSLGADGVEKRRVRDATGRVFEERRIRDPKSGRLLSVELAPTDGGRGRVTMFFGDNKNVVIAFREQDIKSVPWDLVGRTLGEAAKEMGLKAGDSFSVTLCVLA